MLPHPVADDHELSRPREATLRFLQVEDRAGQKFQHTLVRSSVVKCFLCQKQRIVDSAVVDACTLRNGGCKIKCAMLKSVDVVAEDSEKKDFRGSFLEEPLQCTEPDDGVSRAGGRSYKLFDDEIIGVGGRPLSTTAFTGPYGDFQEPPSFGVLERKVDALDVKDCLGGWRSGHYVAGERLEPFHDVTKASHQALSDLLYLTPERMPRGSSSGAAFMTRFYAPPERIPPLEQQARDELHVIVCRLNRICARACRLSPLIRKSVVWTCDGSVLLEPQEGQRLLKTIDTVEDRCYMGVYCCRAVLSLPGDDPRVSAQVLAGCDEATCLELHQDVMYQFKNQYMKRFADYAEVFMKCVRDRASARGWTIKDDGNGGFCCRLFEKTLKHEADGQITFNREAFTPWQRQETHRGVTTGWNNFLTRGKKRIYNPRGTLCAEFSAFRVDHYHNCRLERPRPGGKLFGSSVASDSNPWIEPGDKSPWIKPGDCFEPHPDHPWPTCDVPRFNVRVGLRVCEPGESRFDALCWKIGGFGSFARDEIVVVEASDEDNFFAGSITASDVVNASVVSPSRAMDFGPDTRVFFADAEEMAEVHAGLEAAVTASLELHQEAKQIIAEKYKGEQEKSHFFDALSFTLRTGPGTTPFEDRAGNTKLRGPPCELLEDPATELVLFLDDDVERARHIENGEKLFRLPRDRPGETLLDHILREDYRVYHEDTARSSSDRDPAVPEGERGASGPPMKKQRRDDGAEKSNDEVLHLRLRAGIRVHHTYRG